MESTSFRTCIAAAAVAAGALGAAHTARAQTAPDAATGIYLDNSELWVKLNNHDHGYQFIVTVPVYGPHLGTNAAARVEWKQGGRTLATAICPLEYPSDDRGRRQHGSVDCTSRGPDLTADGAIDVDISYVDEGAGVTQLLRTARVRVGRFYEADGMDGARPRYATRYQVIGDDLLGSTVMVLRDTTSAHDAAFGQVDFRFWTAMRGSQWPSQGGPTSFLCTVNGQRITQDLAGHASVGDIGMLDARQQVYANGGWVEPVAYNWVRFAFDPDLVYRTPHAPRGAQPPGGTVDLGEHPGDWVCQLRYNMNTVREFRFTVSPDGSLARSAEQQGPSGLATAPDVFLIDTRLPTPDTWDFSVQPDAIRRAGFFGRPWSTPAAMQPMFAALPHAAIGQSEPAAPSGAAAAAHPPAHGRHGH